VPTADCAAGALPLLLPPFVATLIAMIRKMKPPMPARTLRTVCRWRSGCGAYDGCHAGWGGGYWARGGCGPR